MERLLLRIRVAELAAVLFATGAKLMGVPKFQLIHAAAPVLLFALAEALLCWRHPALPKVPPHGQLQSLLASASVHSMPHVNARRSLHIALILGAALLGYLFLMFVGQLPVPWA